MQIEITEDKIKEIVKSYPKQLECHPRGMFEAQLTNHLKKCFGFKIKKKKEEKEKV